MTWGLLGIIITLPWREAKGGRGASGCISVTMVFVMELYSHSLRIQKYAQILPHLVFHC